MRDIETAVENQITSGRFGRRDAILFDFAEGAYGFWWGEGEFTWNSITFVGAGQLLELDTIGIGSDGSPTEIKVRLTAIPNSELTPDVLGSIETYTYHLRPVLLYRFYFDPDTGAMAGTAPVVLFRGYLDRIERKDDPDGAYALEATLVSKSVDYRKAGQRQRGNEQQKLLNGGSTDLFFEHASTAGTQTVQWGEG